MRTQHKTVLIAHHDPQLATMIRDGLRKRGLSGLNASTPELLIKIASYFKVDFAVFDLEPGSRFEGMLKDWHATTQLIRPVGSVDLRKTKYSSIDSLCSSIELELARTAS